MNALGAASRAILALVSSLPRIPRDRSDDYSEGAVAARQQLVREHTGSALEHVASYSLDPGTLPGNIENFLGVAQVPIGLAGPLLVDGEHARGEFYVPLATTEGTLVASYSRGMKLCAAAGGIRTTVVDDRMQRAPVFLFPSARRPATSAGGSPSTTTRSPRPPRRPPVRAGCSTSSSSRPHG